MKDNKERKNHPTTGIYLIYILCFIFRVFEYFVLRTDQTFWGEAFIHKLLGIGILFAALKLYHLNFKDIGLTSGTFLFNTAKGLIFGWILFVIAYLAEIMILISKGNFLKLDLYVSSYSVTGNFNNHTSLLFFILCIAGNTINVVMEEGVFRGLFQNILENRYSITVSALIASMLFGIWHIAAPIRSFLDGMMGLEQFIANAIMLLVTTFLIGFKFAMLTKLTGSIHMAMGDHFFNNTIINTLHVITKTGADELMLIRISIAQSVSFIIVLWLYVSAIKTSLKQRRNLRKNYQFRGNL